MKVFNNSEALRNNLAALRSLTPAQREKKSAELKARLNDDVDSFLERGGQITQCPPCQCAIKLSVKNKKLIQKKVIENVH